MIALFLVIVRRVLLMAPVLLGLLVLTFLLVRIVPADPAASLAGENATVEQIEKIRKQYGFDRPLYEQFLIYLRQVVRGDLGTSFYTMRPVAGDMLRRLPATLELAFVSLFLATAIGIPLGVLAAVHHNRLLDHLLRVMSVGGLAVPVFWFALMLQLLFSMTLGILPLRGRLGMFVHPPPNITGSYLVDALLTGKFHTFADAALHITLPAITLAAGAIASIVRFTRGGVLETLQKDFVTYETAAGYPRSILIGVYVLRNSLVATITQIGLLFGGVIAGSVVIEAIFDWPGIGTYVVRSIFISDYKATLAATLLVGVIYGIVNMTVDLIHGLIDPRVAEQM